MPHFRSFSRGLLISLSLLGLSVSYAHAALVSGLQNVYIDGTFYDVRFHNNPFRSLWDGDTSGTFENDGSLFHVAPAFWGNGPGAAAAASAIITTLGSDDHMTTSPYGNGLWRKSDSFMVPFSVGGAFSEWVQVYGDHDKSPSAEEMLLFANLDNENQTRVYASFSTSSVPVPVPVPATVWLFGTALIGLVGFSKRKSGITA
jgi:hypothetical protein